MSIEVTERIVRFNRLVGTPGMHVDQDYADKFGITAEGKADPAFVDNVGSPYDPPEMIDAAPKPVESQDPASNGEPVVEAAAARKAAAPVAETAAEKPAETA